MIGFYIAILLIIMSALVLISTIVIIVVKSYFLSKHVRKKSNKEYKKIHGVVSDTISGFMLYNNLTYWTWIFRDIKSEDNTIIKYKKSLRSSVYTLLYSILIIAVCAIYIYITYG